LSMRLTDSVRAVQYEAVGAVRNLAASMIPQIVKKLIECGIVNIVFTVAIDNLSRFNESNCKLCAQLVECMNSFVAADTDCGSALINRCDSLLPVLFQVFLGSYNTEIDLAISNLLFTATDNFGDFNVALVKNNAYSVLLSKLSQINFASVQCNPVQLSNLLVGVRCIGGLTNMCGDFSMDSWPPYYDVLNACSSNNFVVALISLIAPNSAVGVQVNNDLFYRFLIVVSCSFTGDAVAEAAIRADLCPGGSDCCNKH
jgi:hypothetical protein